MGGAVKTCGAWPLSGIRPPKAVRVIDLVRLPPFEASFVSRASVTGVSVIVEAPPPADVPTGVQLSLSERLFNEGGLRLLSGVAATDVASLGRCRDPVAPGSRLQAVTLGSRCG